MLCCLVKQMGSLDLVSRGFCTLLQRMVHSPHNTAVMLSPAWPAQLSDHVLSLEKQCCVDEHEACNCMVHSLQTCVLLLCVYVSWLLCPVCQINPCNSLLHPAVQAGIQPEGAEEVSVQQAYTPKSQCFGCGEHPEGLLC